MIQDFIDIAFLPTSSSSAFNLITSSVNKVCSVVRAMDLLTCKLSSCYSFIHRHPVIPLKQRTILTSIRNGSGVI